MLKVCRKLSMMVESGKTNKLKYNGEGKEGKVLGASSALPCKNLLNHKNGTPLIRYYNRCRSMRESSELAFSKASRPSLKARTQAIPSDPAALNPPYLKDLKNATAHQQQNRKIETGSGADGIGNSI
ncbi:MAG: hypothetical protein U5L09_03285 [Bacteroidales bacterium]|nr:hypothetical protein [Bacteroidales bacterium]